MFQLETLGGLALVDRAGAVATTQPRRLALLALLAAARERGLSRDKLLAYLWPESPEDNARHALEQLLYALRRQVDAALFLGTDPLRLNPEVITSDVAAFEDRFERGELTSAAAFYQGPFLDGFHLGDAGEFEGWVESYRGRLAGRYAAALERLAREAAEKGDRGPAIEAWRKIVTLDPFSARAALGLMTTLADAGERAEAIRHGRAYEALVRQELDAEPATAVSALIRRLLSQTGELDVSARARGEESAGQTRAAHPAPGSVPVAETTRPALQHGPAGSPELDLRAALDGRYAVEREVARGGMGIVFLARDLKHERAVAIKVLRPELAARLGPELFLREIQITARLQHPHIVPMYDSGQVRGFLYYVMPFVEGESLRDRLDREKQLPVVEALRIAREVARTLSYAHGHHLVHRDIKPENILLSGEEVLVTDFGVARAITAAGGAKPAESGIGAGTPAYASPEAASGSPEVDGRADIYALGCVLYEMLTGEPLFAGLTVEGTLQHHVAAEVPPVTRTRTDVPAQVVDALRRALAKTPAERFISALQFAEALTVPVSVASPVPSLLERAMRVVSRPWPMALAGSLAGFAALWVAVDTGGPILRLTTASPRIHSLAVLPLRNLSGDSAQEYFAEGMTEALVTRLGKVGGLQVTSYTSTMHYKGTHATLPEIGRQLKVDAIVEGSVVRAGNRVRVTAQLVEASTDRHLWAESYENDLRDVLDLQDAIARAVTNEVQVRLSSAQPSPLTTSRTRPVDPEAYDLYLRGLAEWNEWTAEGSRKSIEYFDRAVQKDSGYAPVWAGLSDAYDHLGQFNFLPPQMAWPKAKAAALKAIQLDETLSEAHVSLGSALMHEWSWPDGERELQRAIALNPNNSLAHQRYGYALSFRGQFDGAIREMQRALELDPLSGGRQNSLAAALYRAGRYDDALQYWRQVPDPDFNSESRHRRIASIYEREGKLDDAMTEWLTALRLAGRQEVAASVERVYRSSGYAAAKRTCVREDLRAALGRVRGSYPRPLAWNIAGDYALLGQRDSAFHWLERAFREREGPLAFLTTDDRFEAIRSDPRFRDLTRRMGLPDAGVKDWASRTPH
jgi:serine/threonine-protein kinase